MIGGGQTGSRKNTAQEGEKKEEAVHLGFFNQLVR